MTKRLTQNKVNKYVLDGGCECPFCGSTQIEGREVEVMAGSAFQEMSCLACGAEWDDVYHLVGVINKKNGDIIYADKVEG